MAVLNRVKALAVRGFLLLHFTLVVWRVTVSWSDQYWLLAAAIAPFLIEGAYTVVKRAGLEWRLFSLCFFFYLCATLPGIWLLEIKKTITYQDQNYTRVEDIVVSGVEIPVRLSPNTWVLVTEEMMLYLMILGRWLLPRGGVGREQLTQLLFGFVGIASDIMELFSLFDEDPGVRHNTLLTYCILGVWSLSVFQFTLTFASAHRPRRARGLRLSTADHHEQHKRSVLRVELLATVLSMMMQDGPFLAVRLYTMITFNVITYSLVFFTSKNVLVIFLLVYKIFLLLGKLCCPKSHDDLDEDEEAEDGEEFEKDDAFLGRYSKEVMVKDAGQMQHINGRVMHPASRMPQFVSMRNRRQDDGVTLNPVYAGTDKYTRHFLGELQKTYGNRRDVQRMYGNRNAAGPAQSNAPNHHAGNPQRNVVFRDAGNFQGHDNHQNAVEPQMDEVNRAIGDLQRAIEGPATPAKKMVRNKKLVPKESTKAPKDDAPKPDISIISNNDLAELGGEEGRDPHSGTRNSHEVNPNAINQGPGPVGVSLPGNPEETSPALELDEGVLDDHESSVGDTTVLVVEGEGEELADPGRIPTNGAVNALILATGGEWDEESAGQTASPAGQGQDRP